MKKTILSAIFLLGMSCMADAQIKINEYCAANDTIDLAGNYSDWIELYNDGTKEINLKGYALSDKTSNPRKYVINTDLTIPSGGTRLILCNGLGTGANASFKLSSTGDEHIVLSDPKGTIIEDIPIKPLRKDYSYGRISDGADQWAVFAVASPGKPNKPGNAMANKPEFSVTPGFYTSAQTVMMDCPNNVIIYYTTDGSEPTTNSRRYQGPITISSTTPLRAMATQPGRINSEIESGTYFINSRRIDLPVVSLITERKNFYDNKIGIYVAGTNGIPGPCTDGVPKNWHQDWERPVHIEYFDKNKKLQLSQDAGVKITGSCSRNQNMKSLRIIARKQYGDTRLRYKFFDKKDITEFKSIVLRNGANDFGYTMYRDGLVTGLAGESLDIDVQAFQPTIVFLNGEYLGLHNIREKVSAHYLEENYGVDADMVDILENNIMVNEGSRADYDKLMKFVETNSLKDQDNYNKVAAQMDISNFIDYWCAQIYIDNEDWPNNNIKWWRSQGVGGKWRWIMFGAEFSCNIYGGSPNVNSVYHSISPNTGRLGSSEWGGKLMRKLLENDGFRNQFIQRMAYVMDHTYNYNRVAEFADSLQQKIENEWETFANRWPDWWGGHWYNHCWNMKEWFRARPDFVEMHMQGYFGVGPRYQLNVQSDIPETKYSINGSMPTANINGKYFSGADIELSAKLPKGKQVDYWEIKGAGAQTNTALSYQSDGWMYYNQNHEPNNYWKEFYYDETGWQSGKAPLGYSNSNSEATRLQYGPDPNDKWISYYFRKKFNINDNLGNVISAKIDMKIDDGAVVYVNGQEIGRIIMPDGDVNYYTTANSYYADVNDLPTNILTIPTHLLRQGENMLVVELHQCSNVSSDISIDAQITYETINGVVDYTVDTPTLTIPMGSETTVKLHTKAAPAAPERTQPASNLFINEVMPHNYGAVADEKSNFPPWIEIYNNNSQPVDLSGLYIMDQKNEYQLPQCQNGELTVPAKGHIVLFADGKTDMGPLHLGITIKPDKDGTIYLGEIINKQSRYIHWLSYPELGKNQSHGLVSDGANASVNFAQSSPYQTNSNGQLLDEKDIFTVAEDIDTPIQQKFKLYPNPTVSTVYIETETDVQYTVINMSGQVVLSGTGRSINMDGMHPGLYIVRIQSGTIFQGVRLIKL